MVVLLLICFLNIITCYIFPPLDGAIFHVVRLCYLEGVEPLNHNWLFFEPHWIKSLLLYHPLSRWIEYVAYPSTHFFFRNSIHTLRQITGFLLFMLWSNHKVSLPIPSTHWISLSWQQDLSPGFPLCSLMCWPLDHGSSISD